MAQHNDTLKDDIAAAAYRLFLDNGYTSTTYRDIAKAVGKDRTLVQYHFPKKERLVLELLRRLLEAIEVEILTNHNIAREPIPYRAAMAQIYYAFLIDPTVRSFTLDFLSSRAITHEVLLMEADWNVTFLEIPSAERRDAVDQTIIAIGGVYELLYTYLLAGETPDPGRLAIQTLVNSFPWDHSPDPAAVAQAVAQSLSAEELVAATRNIRRAILGT